MLDEGPYSVGKRSSVNGYRLTPTARRSAAAHALKSAHKPNLPAVDPHKIQVT